MDKSDTSEYKSLCYNCLFKLQHGDIEKKVCPACDMPVNKDGLPLKNSSNSTWKKSDTGDSKVDEEINKELAQDQGFHYGKITRLRYGITEGNYGNWIINPDKSFDYQYKYDKLLINRYRLTKSATTLKKTSSLNIIRNGLKEMLTNSKYTPSILYIELTKAKPNYPTHIILLEEKFLNARFGKSTGINLLLNLIHTNNFFPVTSSLHRKTVIYKVSKNYEQSISTSYLMPSSGLTVIERIPHNHLSLFDDETQLKKDIEDSLKFVNIKSIHQYIPTVINKTNMIFGAEIKKDLGIIEDDDDKMSQLSDLSVTSDGEVISRTTSSTVKPKPKSNLLHMGIPDKTEAKSEKSNLQEDKSSKTDEKKPTDARKAILEHMGIFDTSSDTTKKTTKSKTRDTVSMSDLEDITQESIGIDFLGDNTTQESEEIKSESQDESDQFRIGIDFLGERNAKIRQDEDKSKDRDEEEEKEEIEKAGDKVKSHKKTDNQSNDDNDEKERDESDSNISFGSDISADDTDEDNQGRIGIDFLGEKRQITKNNRKVTVDFNDSGKDDDHDDDDDVKVTFKKHTVKNTDSDDEDTNKVEKDNESEKSNVTYVNEVDLPDYSTPLHNFWGDFNKSKKNVRNSAKKYSKKDTIMYETDEESDITMDNDSEVEDIEEKEPEKNTKPKRSPKKKTEEKEPEKKTKPKRSPKKKTEEKKPKKNTKPKRSPKKKTEEKEPEKNTKPKRSPKKKTEEKKPKKNTKSKRSPKKKTEEKEPKKNTSDKKRDNKGRYVSSSKRDSSNKRKSKSNKKSSKKKSSKKQRDTKGRYISPKNKTTNNDSRSRDSKGRFKPVR